MLNFPFIISLLNLNDASRQDVLVLFILNSFPGIWQNWIGTSKWDQKWLFTDIVVRKGSSFTAGLHMEAAWQLNHLFSFIKNTSWNIAAELA